MNALDDSDHLTTDWNALSILMSIMFVLSCLVGYSKRNMNNIGEFNINNFPPISRY